MVEQLLSFWEVLKPNLADFILEGGIIVSCIIAFIGILKTVIINKIPNKIVRKVTLSILSILCSFGCTAVQFLIKNIEFANYLYIAIPTSLATILVYWVYENFAIRDLVLKIGNLTLGKVCKILTSLIKKIFTGEKIDVSKELVAGLNTIKDEIVKEIPDHLAHDKEIDKL